MHTTEKSKQNLKTKADKKEGQESIFGLFKKTMKTNKKRYFNNQELIACNYLEISREDPEHNQL